MQTKAPVSFCRAAYLSIVGGTLMLSACARTVVDRPQDTDFDPADQTASLDFWHELPGRSAVTNNEGLHGVLVFNGATDEFKSYDERVAHFKKAGWLRADFDEPANLAMQRGTLAKLLAHALDIDGGVMMQVTGKSPRYAMRELVYLNMMPPGTDQQVLSGQDYVAAISKAQDYALLRESKQASETRDRSRPTRELQKLGTTPPASSAAPNESPAPAPTEPQAEPPPPVDESKPGG